MGLSVFRRTDDGRLVVTAVEPELRMPPSTKCRSCGAPVHWIVQPNLKRHPLDWNTARDIGNAHELESHFAHCPHSEGWKKATP